MNLFDKFVEMKFILIFISLLFSIGAFSQSRKLILHNETEQKNFIVNEAKDVTIYSKNNSTFKGKLLFKDDSTLLVNDSIIPISSISRIKIKYVALLKPISGAVLTITGSTASFLAAGTVSLGSDGSNGAAIHNHYINNHFYTFCYGGCAMGCIGIILLVQSLFDFKEFDCKNENWKVLIFK